MAKKSSIMKKVNPLLKDANELKLKKHYDEAISKYREAVSYIRLKGRELEDREAEVNRVNSLINQTFSTEIRDIISQAKELVKDKKFDEARDQLKNATIISENIEDSFLKSSEAKNINSALDQTNIKELENQGELKRGEGKFEEAIKIFSRAMTDVSEKYSSSLGEMEISNIQNLINQTYSDKIKIVMDEASQLKQVGKLDDAITTYQSALDISDNMFDSEMKYTEIAELKNEINIIFSEQIKPNIEKGQQLLEQNSEKEARATLVTALDIQKKMYESNLKTNDLAKIGVLLNPILTKEIESVTEKGKELTNQENYEQSTKTVSDAAGFFQQGLDIANEMANSQEKDGQLEQLTSLIDNTCLAGIKVRQERGIDLISQKKFEEAVGEMYSALSIAKNMSPAENENEEIDKIKGLVNQTYIAQTKVVLEEGKELLTQKKYDDARDVFNEAMKITNKMYVSEETEKEINLIKNYLYQAEMKQVVAEGFLSEEQQKFEKDLENLQEELDKANLITDTERRRIKIEEVKHLIDTTYSNQINLLVEQGDQCIEQDQFESAIEMIDNALKLIDVIENNIIRDSSLSKIIGATNSYGNDLAENTQFADAFEDFEKALTIAEKISDKNIKNDEIIKIKEYYTLELNNKAEIDIETREFDNAIKSCEKSIELDSDFPLSYFNMGNAYHNKKDYDTAINNYKKAEELNPEYKEAWNGMGFSYELKSDYDNALNSLKTAIKIDANYAMAHYNMGNVYKHRNELDNAIESYKKVVELNPNQAKAWLFLASIYHEQKEYNIAIQHLEKAVELEPVISEELGAQVKTFNEMNNSLEEKFAEMFKNK
ncbi:MAG: tetratricopeptide repeat protein [Promethearchaeota archaeon]